MRLNADWKGALLQKCLAPFMSLLKIIFKKSLVAVHCLEADDGAITKKYGNNLDYVRNRTLGLLADIVKRDISEEYAIAELGVFRGDFSARIQDEFPDKRIYLFDTFEGFEKNDRTHDIQSGFSKESTHNKFNFASTSVSEVLNKMSNPDNVTICKGFFPESVTEEHKKIKWGLVSLDVDLYKPTLEGLRFFYPSLVGGGYIMIHDYNSLCFTGVKKAVEDFEAEILDKPLVKIPIPDHCGSLIIAKKRV